MKYRTNSSRTSQHSVSVYSDLTRESVLELGLVILTQTGVFKAGAAHGGRDRATSLGRVVEENSSEVHAGRGDIVGAGS